MAQPKDPEALSHTAIFDNFCHKIFTALTLRGLTTLFENPLLPHRKLRELHALMLRCRDLERKQKPSQLAAREAILAATSIHLQPGDLLSAEPLDQTTPHLAPNAKKDTANSVLTAPSALTNRLTLCAAAARGLQAAGSTPETTGIVIAHVRSGTLEPGWQAALDWAQQAQLPLLLAVADATGGKPSRTRRGEPALDWASVSRLARRNKIAVLSVDGEDAVAVYRVMQESVLRARLGGGPAVIWGVLSPLTAANPRLQRTKQPIVRLENYLAARNISL